MNRLTVKKNYGNVATASSSLGVVLQKHLRKEGGHPPCIAMSGFFTSVKSPVSLYGERGQLYNSRKVKVVQHLPSLMFLSARYHRGFKNSFSSVFLMLKKEKAVMSNNTPTTNKISQLEIAKRLAEAHEHMRQAWLIVDDTRHATKGYNIASDFGMDEVESNMSDIEFTIQTWVVKALNQDNLKGGGHEVV